MKGSYIEIHDLVAMCRLGVSEEERQYPQKIFISFRMYSDFRSCEENDEIEKTVDYSVVIPKISSSISGRSFHLIEYLANEIRKVIKETFPVKSVDIYVKKPNVLQGVALVAYSSVE